MDQTTKFLLKLSLAERNILVVVFQKIRALDLDSLDVKKLQGEVDLFRVRKGKIRIIFRKEEKMGTIVNIDYRDKIYKKL